MNETRIRKGTIMKRTTTLALLALACLAAIPATAQGRYRDGMNLYEYVRSEPAGYRDPSGRFLAAFDGTMNDKESHTNVWVFKELYRTNAEQKGNELENKKYLPGIASKTSQKEWGETIFKNARLGFGSKKRVKVMLEYYCKFLKSKGTDHQGNRDLNLDVIGFSRGAASARDFLNKVEPLLTKYKARVRFVGLFDTVAAMGGKKNSSSHTVRRSRVMTQTETLNLAMPKYLKRQASNRVFHAMSLDENREIFAVDRYAGATEVWFRGVRSDIGGGYGRGYPEHGKKVPGRNAEIADRSGLSNITLFWMVHHAQVLGVPVDLKTLVGMKYYDGKLKYPVNRANVMVHNELKNHPNGEPEHLYGLRAQWVYNEHLRKLQAGDQIHVSAAGLLGLLGRDRGKPGRGGNRIVDQNTAKQELWMPGSGSIDYWGRGQKTLDKRFDEVINMNHKGINIKMNNDGNMWKMK